METPADATTGQGSVYITDHYLPSGVDPHSRRSQQARQTEVRFSNRVRPCSGALASGSARSPSCGRRSGTRLRSDAGLAPSSVLKGIERPERSRANGHNIVGRRRQAPTPATTGAHVRPRGGVGAGGRTGAGCEVGAHTGERGVASLSGGPGDPTPAPSCSFSWVTRQGSMAAVCAVPAVRQASLFGTRPRCASTRPGRERFEARRAGGSSPLVSP